ncbi:MAG: hypothetical protein ABSF14_22755 [Terriglobia bacterium]
MLNKMKALAALLLPFLVFGALAALLLFIQRGPHGAPAGAARPTPTGDWLFADTASSGGASVEVTQGLQEIPGKGATTVTTYTVYPTY